MPFRSDDGIYEEGFIEERRSALEAFVNKIAGWFKNYSWHCNPDPFCQKFDGLVSGHPLAQNERCLHMFLQVGGSFNMTCEICVTRLLFFFRRHILTGITCLARLGTHRVKQILCAGKNPSLFILPLWFCTINVSWTHSFSLWQKREISAVLRNAFLNPRTGFGSRFQAFRHQSRTVSSSTECQL